MERISWNSNNSSGAMNSLLKLPIPGGRNGGGVIVNVGINSYYWSSTISTLTSRLLNFHSIDATMSEDFHAGGFSVRCIKN
jgi:hypothetical protein